MNPSFTADFDRQGFALVPAAVACARIDALKNALGAPGLSRAERRGATYGIRNLLGLDVVKEAASSPVIAAHLTCILGDGFKPVRGLFFDKTAEANWPVAWHQDLSLAVRKSKDVTGWTNWSIKRGVAHAQPPPGILDRMVTVRIHLDACSADNGPLRLVPGSHHAGLLSRKSIECATASGCATILADAGDALFMRPLTLHASSPSRAPTHRRVLHLEFAPENLLPEGLEWAAV